MIRSTRRSLATFIRIAAFAAFMVGPVGAFAYASAGSQGSSLNGAGFVLYISLQRNAG